MHMPHDPSRYNCSECKKSKTKLIDGVDVGGYCSIDGKSIEFWGKDKCPKENKKIKEK